MYMYIIIELRVCRSPLLGRRLWVGGGEGEMERRMGSKKGY